MIAARIALAACRDFLERNGSEVMAIPLWKNYIKYSQ